MTGNLLPIPDKNFRIWAKKLAVTKTVMYIYGSYTENPYP
jgi:hypothetical protein